MAVGSLFILLLLGLVIALAVVIGLLCTRRKPAPAAYTPPPEINPADRQQEREAILEQLAQKEISQDEAEQKLRELDNPVPAEMPPPPAQQNNRGCGCLAAVVIALVLFGLLAFLLLGFFGIQTRSSHEALQQTIRLEELPQHP